MVPRVCVNMVVDMMPVEVVPMKLHWRMSRLVKLNPVGDGARRAWSCITREHRTRARTVDLTRQMVRVRTTCASAVSTDNTDGAGAANVARSLSPKARPGAIVQPEENTITRDRDSTRSVTRNRSRSSNQSACLNCTHVRCFTHVLISALVNSSTHDFQALLCWKTDSHSLRK